MIDFATHKTGLGDEYDQFFRAHVIRVAEEALHNGQTFIIAGSRYQVGNGPSITPLMTSVGVIDGPIIAGATVVTPLKASVIQMDSRIDAD